jgi:hypothetical protein
VAGPDAGGRAGPAVSKYDRSGITWNNVIRKLLACVNEERDENAESVAWNWPRGPRRRWRCGRRRMAALVCARRGGDSRIVRQLLLDHRHRLIRFISPRPLL